MANKKISQLTANTTPATTYVIAVQDAAGSTEAGKTTLAQIKAALSLDLVDNTSDATKNAATVTLTNKTIGFGNNTITTTLAQLNSAVSDADVVSLAGSETLTNKTISGASNTLSAIAQSSVTNLVSDLAAKQPLDTDLTTIAALTPSASDVLQFISGAWANRTMSQLKTSLAIVESDIPNLVSDLASKQATLVSGTNIKTINGSTILGSGNLVISGGGGAATWGSITGTLSAQTDLNSILALKKDVQVISQSTHGFTIGMAVQRGTGGTWIRCRAANTANLSYADGIVIAVPDANTFKIGSAGDVFDATGLGLASNSVYFLDTTSSGINYSATAPSAIGDVYKEIFRTNAANQAYIINGPSFEITTATSGGGGGGNKYWQYQQWEHFTIAPQTTQNGSSLVMATNGGAGSGFTASLVTPSTMTGYVGVVQGTTGTTTTGFASLGQVNTPNMFRFDGNQKIRVGHKVYIDTLRDVTDDYRIVVGFQDGLSNGAVPFDGAYFQYSSASTAWQYVTANSATRTTANSSTTVTALTTYILEVEYDGAGGINFYINGTLVNTGGTAVTANVPVTAGRETAFGATITKIAGTNARTLNVDWVALGVDYA